MPNYDAVPAVLKGYRQWVVWRYEESDGEKPTKVPYTPETGMRADVNRPETWSTFDAAKAAALNLAAYYTGIGFVLTESDPFAVIDLDAPKRKANQSDEEYAAECAKTKERQEIVYNEFNTFAERSPSGEGAHIWCCGSVPAGRRRGSIEVYSSQRYMTVTGDVIRQQEINDCQSLLTSLWETLGKAPTPNALSQMGLAAETTEDGKVLEYASNAANGEKFKELFFQGNWQRYYPSQSEADFALVDILAFYSGNRMQVQRLFLQSTLGQREKSRAQYRLNYMLNRCFDRMLPPIDIEGLQNQLREAVEAQRARMIMDHAHIPPPEPLEQTAAAAPAPIADDNPYTVPPGLVGWIAQFIYAQSPRPVAEIALVGALGLVAAITGRAYNVSNTGLNGYFLALASTGAGKEAIASGISKLMQEVIKTVPAAADFVGPSEISSAPALIKYLGNKSIRFVSIVGEYGIMLKNMTSEHAPAHLSNLKRTFLDLYNKSGHGSVMRPTIYSDKDKNTAALLSPAFSLIGESTPERFYEALDEDMISEGFLPRFSIIEYKGPRVPLNYGHAQVKPSPQLVECIAQLCANCLALDGRQQVIDVQFTEDADTMMRQFNEHCDEQLNATDREVTKNLWNRAHVKAMKLAAEVAVGCNPYAPIITRDNASWAIGLVLADVKNLQRRFETGLVGANSEETKQLEKMVQAFRDYTIKPWTEIEGYKTGTQFMHSERVIPYSYLFKRCAQATCFTKSRLGAATSIKATLKTLTERGDIRELAKTDCVTKYMTSAICYMITNPKAFGL